MTTTFTIDAGALTSASGAQGPRVFLLIHVQGAERSSRIVELPDGAEVTVGRSRSATVMVDHDSVSRLHARIRRDDAGAYWLYDEGSAAGTFLNYEQLGLAPRPLQHGDVVQLGRVTLRFRLELAGWAGRAAPEPPNTEEWHADDADFTDRRG